jgi:hypothetical protein
MSNETINGNSVNGYIALWLAFLGWENMVGRFRRGSGVGYTQQLVSAQGEFLLEILDLAFS